MSNTSINIKDFRKEHSKGKIKSSVRVEEKDIWSFLNKDVHLSNNKLPNSTKEGFYLEAGILLEAGVDIRTVLDLVKEEQEKKKYKQMFNTLQERVVAGATLSAAMQQSGYFISYEYYSVQIGEETGRLVIILKGLADYFQKRIKQRRQILSALTYPVVILLVAFGAVSFMMAYVVPMFADILKRFGSDLPFITKMVLAISAWVKKSFLFFIVAIVGIAIVCVSQRRKEWFRSLTSRMLLKVPVIGAIIRKINLARFSNTMSLLIVSKIPILQAIQLVNKMIDFYPVEKSLAFIEKDIISGIPLHKSMSLHDIYPAKMVLLIKVGEEVNRLDTFFSKVAEQYNSDVEHQTNILSKLLEPLIIIILGLVVGIILIAMYLPLFKLGQAF